MPLVRYEIQNENKLGNLELYRTASKDDPKSMLEGVTMVGLVGILRQLGDLAEFAAEIFHHLHEEVMATAARGHDLVARVLQLEGEVPYIEKVLPNSDPVQYFSLSGMDWHATIRSDQNHFTQGDLPRFIRSSYADCREPPRLFLLDKFDVGGAEACLKRYTDPSFFKKQWANTELSKAEKSQQERKARRGKKKPIRRSNNEGLKTHVLALSRKPRRVRYSSLSSDNLEYVLDSASLLSTGNQFNSSFKPMDVVSIPESSEHVSLSKMSISTFKEPISSTSISETSGLILNKAQDPAEGLIVEALSMTSRDQEFVEERGMPFDSLSGIIEEQSMLEKEEKQVPIEDYSPKKVSNDFSIDSDRFEDAITTRSQIDIHIMKLQLVDNHDVEDDGEEMFDVQVRDVESHCKVGFGQETSQVSVGLMHLQKESMEEAKIFLENSDILQEHAEMLCKSGSNVTRELDKHDIEMNAHYETASKLGANFLVRFDISGNRLENHSASAICLQYVEDNESANSAQTTHDSVDIQEDLALGPQLDALGLERSVETVGASKFHGSKENDHDTANIDGEAIKSEASMRLCEQLLTGSEVPTRHIERESLETLDHMLNTGLEILAEDFVPDIVQNKVGLPWTASDALIDGKFDKDLYAAPQQVQVALKELASDSSCDLDKFEVTMGSELDTGLEPALDQEPEDIASLQGTSATSLCTPLPFPELCKSNNLENVQKVPEDSMQADLEADCWRQSDVLLVVPEPANKNSLSSSIISSHSLEMATKEVHGLEVLVKSLHLENSAASDDLCETKSLLLDNSAASDDLCETGKASSFKEVFDEKLSQPEHIPLHSMALDVTELHSHVTSQKQQIAGTTELGNVIDHHILVDRTGFAGSSKPELPDDVLASRLAIGKDAQVSFADFKEHAKQIAYSESGLSAYPYVEDAEDEDFEKDPPIAIMAHLERYSGKHDPLLHLESLQLATSPPSNILYSKDSEFVEAMSAFSDSSGPSSVPFNLATYDPSHSRTSSENFRENIAQDSPNKEVYESQGLEFSEPLIANPVTHADTLFDADAAISVEWQKAENQNKSKDFLPFTSRSPPLSPISTFELPVVHKLHDSSQDSTDDYSKQWQIDKKAKPRLSLDVSLDDSPAISPIVSPMWSSESPAASAEPNEFFAEGLDEGIPSQSPLRPSSSLISPTTPRELYECISDSELKPSIESLSRDPLNTLALSTISSPFEGLVSNNTDKKDVSPFPLTSSPSRSPPNSPTSPDCEESEVDDLDNADKASDVLSYVPILGNDKCLIPEFESVTSQPFSGQPEPDVLVPFIQPAHLSMEGSPSAEIGALTLSMEVGSASPESLKSPNQPSKDKLSLNGAEELFPMKSISDYAELRPTTPSVKLEKIILHSFSSEGESSVTCEELSSSSQVAPAPPAVTPPGKPPNSFHGLSRALTSKPSLENHAGGLSKPSNASIRVPHKVKNVNNREGLLEQIRTQSFNLRHMPVEKKHELPSRPVPNINVAAILEKAYSIRQALVGSDEDEDSDSWSDQ